MKMQASVEFLAITGAIGLLILSAVVQYHSTISSARKIANMSYGNYSVISGQVFASRPYLDISIPETSVADSQNFMQIAAYGCGEGNAVVVLNSSDIEFDPSMINESFYSARIWKGSFYPNSGADIAYVKYGIYCGKQWYNGSEELATVALLQKGGQESLQYSAIIYGRNESADYPASDQKVYALAENNHCAYLGPFGNPYGMDVQCSGGWGYNIVNPGACPYQGNLESFCVKPQYSGYNVSFAKSGQPKLAYSANVTIIGNGTLSMRISNGNASSDIFYASNIVGKMHVRNVSYSGVAPGIAMLSGKSEGYVNSTDLSQYEQEWNNAYDIVTYYNNAVVSPSVQSEIEQAVSSYDTYEGAFVSGAEPLNQSQCSLKNNTFDCSPSSPFYYVINATVNNGYLTGNQVLSYAGSVIEVSD